MLTSEKGEYMSVVIIGGNECMTRQYMDLCKEYNCKAKVYPKMKSTVKDFGCPDLLVLFTNTMSHKLLKKALDGTKGQNTIVARSHSSSMAALKTILKEHTA